MSKSYFIPINVDIYRTKSFIAINIKDKELEKRLIEEGISEKEAKCLVKDSKVTDDYQGMTALCDGYSLMRYNSVEDVKDINIVCHESFHAVSEIMRYVDIPLKHSSEEAYAYLLGYIVEHYSEILKDVNKK